MTTDVQVYVAVDVNGRFAVAPKQAKTDTQKVTSNMHRALKFDSYAKAQSFCDTAAGKGFAPIALADVGAL